MPGGFLIRVLLGGFLGGVRQILDRALKVPPAFKMHRQLGGNLPGATAVALRFSLANLAMPTAASRHRDPVVQHVLIQGVNETVVCRRRPVRPLSDALRAQKLTAPR